MITATASATTIESVYEPVLQALENLLVSVRSESVGRVALEHAFSLLETLPLSSSEYGVARLRLTNAKNYLTANEHGAAAWEIRTVMLALRANVVDGHRQLKALQWTG
ncbi:hypothetical protein CKO51_20810 [Rhodopirellula sp. SM50]|nr:hypothetical protein [Rhodopirellula sp. SM50]PAY17508.1 hypothetical protein CKO51_20810 [Rhodopirellula sp. SM50]